MQIGIDTSVIVGLLDSRDIWHTPAVNLQEAIAAAGLEPVYQPVPPTDPDPKALACYGLLVQERTTKGMSQEHGWLRCVAERLVSSDLVYSRCHRNKSRAVPTLFSLLLLQHLQGNFLQRVHGVVVGVGRTA